MGKESDRSIESRVADDLHQVARLKWHEPWRFERLSSALGLPLIAGDNDEFSTRVQRLKDLLQKQVIPGISKRDNEEQRNKRSVAMAARILYRFDRSTAADRIGERQEAIAKQWGVHPGHFAQALEADIHQEVAVDLCALNHDTALAAADRPTDRSPKGGREFRGSDARKVIFGQVAFQLQSAKTELLQALEDKSLGNNSRHQESLEVALWRLYCPNAVLTQAFEFGLTLGGFAHSRQEYAAAEAILIGQFTEPIFGMRGRSALSNAANENDLDSFLARFGESSKSGENVHKVWSKWASACFCDLEQPDVSGCQVHRLLHLHEIATNLLDTEELPDKEFDSYQNEIRVAREDVFARHFPDVSLTRREAPPQKGQRVLVSESGTESVLLSSMEPAPHYLIALRFERPAIPVLKEVLLQSNADLATGEVYADDRNQWT